jgi:hypothetical protein
LILRSVILIAILNAVGNAMILLAQPSAILYVRDQSAKFNVKRLLALAAKFIAINQNVTLDAPRRCANPRTVLSAKLFALLLTAVLLVLLLSQSAPQCANKLNVTGNAKSQPLVLVLSANYNAISQPAKLRSQKDIIVVLAVASALIATSRPQ